ncbi:hypothetical protein FKM82_007275 [Ascaphus truei]
MHYKSVHERVKFGDLPAHGQNSALNSRGSNTGWNRPEMIPYPRNSACIQKMSKGRDQRASFCSFPDPAVSPRGRLLGSPVVCLLCSCPWVYMPSHQDTNRSSCGVV